MHTSFLSLHLKALSQDFSIDRTLWQSYRIKVMFIAHTVSTLTHWPFETQTLGVFDFNCALAYWLARFAGCMWGTHQLRSFLLLVVKHMQPLLALLQMKLIRCNIYQGCTSQSDLWSQAPSLPIDFNGTYEHNLLTMLSGNAPQINMFEFYM